MLLSQANLDLTFQDYFLKQFTGRDLQATVVYTGKVIGRKLQLNVFFASDSSSYQIILLQHTEKKQLLNVPAPRNKVYKGKHLYQALKQALKFAVSIS